MDSRRWWLLAAAVPVALGCALATAQPALRLAGQLVRRRRRAPRGRWCCGAAPRGPPGRALAAAGRRAAAAGARAPCSPSPTPVRPADHRRCSAGCRPCPATCSRSSPSSRLVDRRRLRAGPRLAVEVGAVPRRLPGRGRACSSSARPGAGRRSAWSSRLVLGAAVLVTSATMAAALTLLGVIEAARRPMARRRCWSAPSCSPLGRGVWHVRAAVGHAAVPAGVSPRPRRRRPARCWPSPSCSTPARRRGPTTQARRPASTSGSCCRTSRCWPRSPPSAASRSTGVRPSAGADRRPGALRRPRRPCTAGLTAREEQRLGARLRRSEAYFRSLVQSAGDAVVILDDDLRITWASPALERVRSGAAADALVGRPLLDGGAPRRRAPRWPPPCPTSADGGRGGAGRRPVC